MVSFFPTPYPDELLYSILARYHIRSTNISPKATLKELVNSTTMIATFDLPSHIESLISNLPVLSTHTAESLIKFYTLYPLYKPFLPIKRAKSVYNSMCKHFAGDIHSRIGIMASTVPLIKFFRFCPTCVRKDYKIVGEFYWHRLHQVSGVLVCPIHKVCLQNSFVKIKGNNRHEFIAADSDNCVFRPSVVNYTKTTLNKLIKLAEDINLLLNSSFSSKNGDWFRNQYQNLLIDKGLATASGRIHQKDLAQEFLSFYGKEFLELVHSEIDIENESNWLSLIVRKHRKSFHPLRHLLLIRFLGKDVTDFFKGKTINHNYFGKGSWTCFNGASNHYLEKVITSVSISYSSDMKKLVGTFSCFCGFQYSTSDVSVPYSDKLSVGKVKAYGTIWEDKLKSLFANKSLGLRETARQLKVDPKTVLSHAKRLQLMNSKPNAITKTPTKNKNSDRLRTEHQDSWLKIQKEFPKLSKTELRNKRPSVYLWLYRNDRKWLNSNSPEKKETFIKNKRVDWKKRDGKILELSQKCCEKLFNQERPIRITVSRISKEIGQTAVIEKHLDKLPQTKEFLTNTIETVEEFQIRRIRRVISQLLEENEFPRAWKISRLAGLNTITAKKLSSLIDREIQKATRNLRKRSVI